MTKTNQPILLIFTVGFLISFTFKAQDPAQTKNEVIVLGNIHRMHLKKEEYGIEVLKKIVSEINPDIILVEIPPDRFDTAMQGFLETGQVSEPRVLLYPEYTQVIFPLSKEMSFKIIPTSAWTQEMANERSEKLKQISRDSTRKSDWDEYQIAIQKSDSAIKAGGNRFDPYWIHKDAYDQAQEIRFAVYNRLFNDYLGDGGWENINSAHYANIAKALDKYKYQSKRILITYGAGHKGWFLRKLRERDDIELLDVQPFLDRAIKNK